MPKARLVLNHGGQDKWFGRDCRVRPAYDLSVTEDKRQIIRRIRIGSNVDAVGDVTELSRYFRGVPVDSPNDGAIGIWNLDTDEILARFEAPSGTCQMTFSADDSLLAGLGKTVTVWSTSNWKAVHSIQKPPLGFLRGLSFSHDNRYLAVSGEYANEVTLLDVTNGDVSTLPTLAERITALEFHPASNRLLMGTSYGKLHIWDYEMGESLCEFQADSRTITHIYVPKDSASVLCNRGDMLRIFNDRRWTARK